MEISAGLKLCSSWICCNDTTDADVFKTEEYLTLEACQKQNPDPLGATQSKVWQRPKGVFGSHHLLISLHDCLEPHFISHTPACLILLDVLIDST